MPACLIHQQHGVSIGRDGERYLGKMERHGLGIAKRQDQTGALAKLGADRPEDIGRFRPLVLRGRGPRPAPGPAAGYLVFLTDARFILKLNFYGRAALEGRSDLCQLGSEVFFLNDSIANSFWPS